jgi:hypothetical protein
MALEGNAILEDALQPITLDPDSVVAG